MVKNYNLVIGVITRVVPWLWLKITTWFVNPGCPLAMVINYNLVIGVITRVVPWLWFIYFTTWL